MELWYQDEARVGQVGRTGRVWFERGVRPCGLKDMRHQAAWIFGAICPARDTGVALVMPDVGAEAMQALLQELSTNLPSDRHAVLVMDRAGWHIASRLVWPANITPIHLPPYSPSSIPSSVPGCICVSVISATGCSTPTTLSKTPAAKRGIRCSPTLGG